MVQGVAPDDRGGLRRGDVYNALNWHFNKERAPVHDMRTIFSSLTLFGMAKSTTSEASIC